MHVKIKILPNDGVCMENFMFVYVSALNRYINLHHLMCSHYLDGNKRRLGNSYIYSSDHWQYTSRIVRLPLNV